MKIPDDPEITISLLISLLMDKLRTSPVNKIYFYYVHQFIKLHFSLLFGTSSDRYGGIATRFSIFMKDNAQFILQNKEVVLKNILQKYFPSSQRLDSDIQRILISLQHYSNVNLINIDEISLIWYPSSSLISWSKEYGPFPLNPVSNLNAPFSQTQINPIDWRIPLPPPDFPHFSTLDTVVESGHGAWIPKVNSQLEDVGFVCFVSKP